MRRAGAAPSFETGRKWRDFDRSKMPEDAISSPAWRRRLPLIAFAALAMFAFCLVDQNMFADGDTNWHVATGRWILSHGAVPLTDPFSYTAFGHRWVAHEWLSEVLMALAWNAARWSGVMVLTAAGAATTMALLTAELSRRLGTLSVIAAVALCFMMLLGHILARPHIIALPFLVFWMARVMEARRRERAPPIWLAPVVIVWANLHGSFIFGLAFTAPFALEAFLEARGLEARGLAARAKALIAMGSPARADDPGDGPLAIRLWRRLRTLLQREMHAFFSGGAGLVALKWGAFLVAATACALLTPNGVKGLLYGFYVTSMPHLRWINEWKSFSFQSPSFFEMALFFTLFICLYRGVRVGAVRLGLLLLIFYLTLQHLRQEIILAVMAPLLLADPLRRVFEPSWTEHAPPTGWPPPRDIAVAIAVVAALFGGLVAWRVATPEVRRDSGVVPYTALEHVPAALRARPVFNNYSFGGWLVLEGVRPFMDGRSDMYGDDLLKLYLDVEAADPTAVDIALHRYNIQWTILAPSSALVKRLDATPGWRRLYADKWAVVQVRNDAAPPDRRS